MNDKNIKELRDLARDFRESGNKFERADIDLKAEQYIGLISKDEEEGKAYRTFYREMRDCEKSTKSSEQ